MRASTWLAIFGCSLAACVFTRVNPDHCANNGGDAHCAGLGSEAPFCALDDCGLYDPSINVNGCVADRPEPRCASPCGLGRGEACLDETGDATTAEGSTTAESSGTTGDGGSSSSSTGTPECIDDSMCPSDVPFCADGGCVTCSETLLPDTACASVSPEQPYCVDDRCVECRTDDDCGDDAPLCNAGLGICVACSYHDECESGACHLAEGTCIPEFDVRYVDRDRAQNGLGTLADPHNSLYNAIVDVGLGEVIAFVVLPARVPLDQADVTGELTVAIIGGPGSDAVLDVEDFDGSVRVTGGATVYLANMRIRGNTEAPGVIVDGGRLWLDEVEVVQNNGGLDVRQGEIHLRNTVVGRNGDDSSDLGGLRFTQSTFDLVYSTIATNDALGAGHSIRCDANSTGTARNSIIVAVEESIDCSTLVADRSVVDAEGLEGDYVAVPGIDLDWFVDANGADFHLTSAASAFSEVAVWREGDPATDLDGDARPDVDGTAEYPGADRPR